MKAMADMVGRNRIVDSLTMLVVSALSLLLLTYVGFGDAENAATQFQVAKMVAQGQFLQGKMEDYLRSGQPLGQFSGFRSLALPLMESDRTISLVEVRDAADKALFKEGVASSITLQHSHLSSDPTPQVQHDEAYQSVILPLRSKFETVGELILAMPRSAVTGPVRLALMPLLPWCGVLCVILAAVAFATSHWPQKKRTRWQQSLFAGAFLLMSAAVIWALVGLYSDGARAKVRALANSLEARLNSIVDLGLSIDDFSGIDVAMAEYRASNPDIGVVAVLDEGVVIIDTDRAYHGRKWVSDGSTFEFVSPLHQKISNGHHQVIMVTLPTGVVYWAIARNVKNFAALFVATGLIALSFVKMSGALTHVYSRRPALSSDEKLEAITPILFVAVFVDNLGASFLPQLVSHSVRAAALPMTTVSIVFLLYFLAFSLTVLPAESFATRRGPKPLILLGCALAAAGMGLLATSGDLALVALARVLSGCGQGLLLIGVQSFIFGEVTPERRSQGNGLVVFNFNAGMISGMAIGALLALSLTESGVFTVGAVLLAVLAVFAALAIPVSSGAALRQIPGGVNLWRVLFDRGFLECIVLIGIPSKALLSGVIVFAMPLLLAKLNFPHEDIGQLVLFYACGVILANAIIARVPDQSRSTGRYLIQGMVLSAAGLAMIGLVGWHTQGTPLVTAGLVLMGVALLGVAHGLINAPVVTHATMLPIADVVGHGSVAALYRMVERVGHVIGPLLIGQLLLLGDYSPKMLLVPAAVAMAAALIFALSAAMKERAA